MPYVRGFLKVGRRRPGRPDIGLPDPEEPVDPGYGIPEGELPEVEPPDPPPGIWPPATPEHPWIPIPPGGVMPPRPGGRPPSPDGTHPEHPIELPPGTIWPPLPPGVHGKFLALVLIGGAGHGVHYRYVVVDADARPVDPDYGVEGPPPREPKR